MGQMMGVYQATMNQFAHLADGIKPSRHVQPVPPPAAEAAAPPTLATSSTPAVKERSTSSSTVPVERLAELIGDVASESGSDEEYTVWKDYHGREMWKAVRLMKKNQFCHAAYMKRGETVETFEDLMVLTSKTMHQLLEMKCGVSGVVIMG